MTVYRCLYARFPALAGAGLAIGLVACSRTQAETTHAGGPASPTSATQPTAVAAAAETPCQKDADCRLVACAGCTCGGVHVKDPDGCEPAICALWPCTGQVAVCDPGTHHCRSQKTAPPSSSAAPKPSASP